jgi:hypothetical protein
MLCIRMHGQVSILINAFSHDIISYKHYTLFLSLSLTLPTHTYILSLSTCLHTQTHLLTLSLSFDCIHNHTDSLYRHIYQTHTHTHIHTHTHSLLAFLLLANATLANFNLDLLIF